MKILCFDIREEHKPFVKEWSNKNSIEVETVPYGLTLDTVSDVEGFDGITIAEPGQFDSNIYPKLTEYGIKNLAQRTAGFENFDLEAAKENGIVFTNVASYSPESIAEFTLMMALKLVRKSSAIDKKCRNYDFTWTEDVRGRVLREMTVGVLGTGRIGIEVVKLFKGMGAKVLGYDLYPNEAYEDIIEYKDSVEEIVKFSDVVTLHMPSTDSNYHLFDKEMFKNFKSTAYLLNAGRGQLVDTPALLDALDDGLLAGAALDTYENEAGYIPGNFKEEEIKDDVFKKILHHPKIDFTHHIAYYTDTSVQNMIWYALDSTKEIIETGTTANRLN
ncbi:D-2-hydroxyacid dehydrogenase [Aerococcus mictus]|uniref:D-2-hydroxyacid dehydrogenase n=1 Tax=Aerococcus mictus TaxID=2976810 RepID=UPI000DCB0C08|nr:D-2-hydroxyacid dehydrogenase [Aerococcus mictus]KAA9233750.1 D-2-hydroxyacid dehydrogenase [Aerococcus mictus]MDL5183861.1 D-2-hydroxyacid dehydrogenase [Aerococcus mictus]